MAIPSNLPQITNIKEKIMDVSNDNLKKDCHSKKKKRKEEHFIGGYDLHSKRNSNHGSLPVDDNFEKIAKLVRTNVENTDNTLCDNISNTRKKKKKKKKGKEKENNALIESNNKKQTFDIINVKDYKLSKLTDDDNDLYSINRGEFKQRKEICNDEPNDNNIDSALISNEVSKKRKLVDGVENINFCISCGKLVKKRSSNCVCAISNMETASKYRKGIIDIDCDLDSSRKMEIVNLGKEKETNLNINRNDVCTQVSSMHGDSITAITCTENKIRKCKTKKKIKKLLQNTITDIVENSGLQNEIICGFTEAKHAKKKKKVITIDEVNSENEIGVDKRKGDFPILVDSNQLDSTKDVHTDWFSPLHYITGWDNRNQIEMLRNKGIISNRGKWRADEIQKLKDNMKEFLACHEVKDFRRLIISRTKEDKIFRKETDFVFKMCRGIHRTRVNIARRIVIQFSDFLFKGKYSEKERKELIKLYKLHGNNWKQIGILMNRCHLNLHNIHSYVAKPWNKGPWSKEEDKALVKTVNAYLARRKRVSWANVSKIVGTRSRCLCHGRWLTKCIQSNGTEESIVFDERDTYKLISIIWESNVDDEYLIDWNNLSAQFKNMVTPNWLRWKFGVVCKEVPHSHTLEYGELIDQLYDIYQRKISNSIPDNNCNENKELILVEHIDNKVNSTDYNENILLEDSSSDKEAAIFNEVIVID